MKRLVLVLGCTLLVQFGYQSSAKALGKEFMTSATYGVIAGTIVGAATLAFTENPGDKLYRISRGASLGLYAGILLGFYVTYGVSSEPVDEYAKLESFQQPKLAFYPVVGESGLEGAAASWRVHSF